MRFLLKFQSNYGNIWKDLLNRVLNHLTFSILITENNMQSQIYFYVMVMPSFKSILSLRTAIFYLTIAIFRTKTSPMTKLCCNDTANSSKNFGLKVEKFERKFGYANKGLTP